ncbi:ATPase [Paraburkholderia hayleyella]|uniref:ATPase n=1 Tax=Paraburkholderia hayleyella TaxID=2152889 RepID=UPI001292196F|nr:ATPase [Paraburkholderia hayleyella]
MLTELETLSQNIGQLISISRQHHEARLALEAQLAHKHAECDAARAELEAVRAQRDALQAERDTLSAKIDDAQVRLNAILEKLPHGKTPSGPDDPLDLLASASPSGSLAGMPRKERS